MTDLLFSFLSREYSGLLIAVGMLGLGLLAWRRAARLWLRGPGALLCVLGFLLAIGAVSHLVRVAGVDSRYPAPGTLVQVEGQRMHVFAEGPRDAPAIVWFPGGHVGAWAHKPLHDGVKGEFRSILLDRFGTGWSDAGPFPRTTAREADEVIAALDAAGERGPFIFAGHSFGGLLAANIARRYPDRTAAVVLLDPTPLDVLFYGIDRTTLASIGAMDLEKGLRVIFGLYGATPQLGEPSSRTPGDTPTLANSSPFEVVLTLEQRARAGFAGASIYRELTPAGLAERAFDTVVYDGELGKLPVYLVAPGEDPTTLPYAQSVAGDPARAARFAEFLAHSRERYLAASSHSTRIYTPEGTGHGFVSETPQFVIETLRRIAREVSPVAGAAPTTTTLGKGWPGPYGGVPPVDLATPELIEKAYREALDAKRREVAAIAGNPAPPTFNNTVLALERSGTALARVDALFTIFRSTASTPSIAALAARLAPLRSQLEDGIVFEPALFGRIKSVHESLPGSAPSAEARRLVEVTYRRFVHAGAALDAVAQQRLVAIHARISELQAKQSANALQEESQLAVVVRSETELAGLPPDRIAAAKAAAEARKLPGVWLIPMSRPAVWPVLTRANSRSLREEVWRKWVGRGANAGELDNRPVLDELLHLRGEKAQLLGFPSYAHWQTAERMIGTPEAAMALLERHWKSVLAVTRTELVALQKIADAEQLGITLEPWDRLYYAEKYRQKTFGFDAESIRPYLPLDRVIDVMFDAAGRVLGFEFHRIEGVPVVSPDIRVYEVRRDGAVAGVLWMDLFAREGKGPSSWAAQYRPQAGYDGHDLPLVALHSAVQRPADGGPALLEWERANVIFHEFGHALHMLSGTARYPSLGSLGAVWDFIELPSLLNERWLADRDTLRKHARHVSTDEPMPDAMIEGLERSLGFDRVFSATLPYLATALVDMRLHLLADGRSIDAVAVEREVMDEFGMPRAVDPLLHVQHAMHIFTDEYSAGVYTYLWSDLLAADAAEAFTSSPGGLYDAEVAKRWRTEVLERGNTVPAIEAFRAFRGREPDPDALLRRFGMVPPG